MISKHYMKEYLQTMHRSLIRIDWSLLRILSHGSNIEEDSSYFTMVDVLKRLHLLMMVKHEKGFTSIFKFVLGTSDSVLV
jgi:hypothetical protein